MNTVEEMLAAYLRLSPADQQRFAAAVTKVSGANIPTKATTKRQQPGSTDRNIELFYERLRAKVYSYHGIRLPWLASLERKTAAAEELQEVWDWLGGNQAARDFETRSGLVELATEACSRAEDWRSWDKTHRHLVQLLSNIPRIIEDCLPGYRTGGVLLGTAKKLGAGSLTIDKPSTEEQDAEDHHPIAAR